VCKHKITFTQNNKKTPIAQGYRGCSVDCSSLCSQRFNSSQLYGVSAIFAVVNVTSSTMIPLCSLYCHNTLKWALAKRRWTRSARVPSQAGQLCFLCCSYNDHMTNSAHTLLRCETYETNKLFRSINYQTKSTMAMRAPRFPLFKVHGMSTLTCWHDGLEMARRATVRTYIESRNRSHNKQRHLCLCSAFSGLRNTAKLLGSFLSLSFLVSFLTSPFFRLSLQVTECKTTAAYYGADLTQRTSSSAFLVAATLILATYSKHTRARAHIMVSK